MLKVASSLSSVHVWVHTGGSCSETTTPDGGSVGCYLKTNVLLMVRMCDFDGMM